MSKGVASSAKATGAVGEVALQDVRFGYEGWEVAYDLVVESGSRTAVMGPSGSGKSTLLHLVAGFATPARGRIVIAGDDVTRLPPAQRPVSMIFQENNLFGHLDIASNVGLGRDPALKLSDADHHAVAEAIAQTGLAGKESRRPDELSGGERQRAALARALVRNRPVLLLDEAFASLGPGLKADMLDLVGSLVDTRQMTMLMVTHDPDDALRVATRLVFVEDGRIAATGPVADMLGTSAPDAVLRYLGTRPRQD